jgi:hypothetical protein
MNRVSISGSTAADGSDPPTTAITTPLCPFIAHFGLTRPANSGCE